jgi:hypothetical protein
MAERYAPPVPTAHPLYQSWVMLLNGYGYNWYRRENALRSDDLLIRSKASDHLAAASSRLREAEGAYRRTYLPPPTREHPDPDPVRLAAARRLHAAADRIAALDTKLRGAAVPPDDKIWARYRDEAVVLSRLADWDTMLAGAAREIEALAGAVTADAGLDDVAERTLDERLADLAAALEQRKSLLAGPV